MSRQSLSEQLWQGLGDAVNDIRTKVVEEPLYGRAVTEKQEGRTGRKRGTRSRLSEPARMSAIWNLSANRLGK